jgi:methylthioribose-1-phosphate isomerase
VDIKTIALNDTPPAVVILDQARLPNETRYVRLATAEEVWRAIKTLQVRGAPAIGIAAAMGLYLHMQPLTDMPVEAFTREFEKTRVYLSSSRPTAVNLDWALARMARVFDENKKTESIPDIIQALKNEALLIHKEDADVCKAIGEHGAALLKPGMGILTHCNAGALAASAYGTALAPVYVAHERGISLRVYADETRPLLQGARLTAYELQKAGVDVTLLCDNMASGVMRKGWIDAVFVGCDRVAANGDTANKIGTSGVAVLAKEYGIPFYVCAPYSTIDFSVKDGDGIIIEERDGAEVTDMWYERPMAPAGVKVYNPAFDITPAKYITAFITEKGFMPKPIVK